MEVQRKGRTHLIIPDSHAKPDVPNKRFDLLCRLIMDVRPDVIINIGDMADMEALCSYDRGTKGFEGRRYMRDVEATKDALRRLHWPIEYYNAKQRSNKQKQYKPEWVITIGNHEDRIDRATSAQPELDGTISIDDLGYKEYGYKVVPFLEPINIDGVMYAHYFSSGIMGRPIGGEHSAYTCITKHYQSCISGHSHVWDYCERTTAEGKRLQSMVVGCYLEPDQYESYAKEANKMWFKGITILRNVVDGEYDFERISIDTMIKEYGNGIYTV